MDKKNANIMSYIKLNRTHRAWRKILAFLGCIVVFCTAYLLMLPAIAEERSCGLEAHTHGESCYTQQTDCFEMSLACNFAAHSHSDSCADVCAYAGFAVHTHNELCYEGDMLVCLLPQIQVHTHTDSCYQPVHSHGERCYNTVLGALVCDLAAGEGHTHTESCWETTEICGQMACEGHAHNDGCYTTSRSLICGLEESGDHAHDSACYAQSKVLSCTLEEIAEHIHTDACFQSQLICSQEETEGHAHVDECFVPLSVLACTENTEQVELVCTQEEILLHTHEASCFAENDDVKTLVCGALEVTEHVHGEDCLTVTRVLPDSDVLTCTKEEGQNHSHSAMCYGTWTLNCTVAEHIHSESCSIAADPSDDTTASIPAQIPDLTEPPMETAVPESTGEPDLEDSGISAFILRPTTEVDSGVFQSVEGNALTWVLSKDTLTGKCTLTIDGEGMMPEFSASSAQPWRSHLSNSNIIDLVFGEGIKRIGARSFADWYISSIEWGGVEEIGNSAFASCSSMTAMNIPGNVKRIEDSAFSGHKTLYDITLNEGTEYIGANAFNFVGIATKPTYIPSTLTYIGTRAFGYAKEYVMPVEGDYFCVIDGVLFSKDKKTLVSYPRCREADEYRVPDHVEVIGDYVFNSTKTLKNLYIPASVKKTQSEFIRGSSIQYLYYADGCVPETWLSYNSATSLTSIRFPENTAFSIGNMFHNGTYPNITSFTIPNGVTSISEAGHTFYLPSFQSVLYDARNASVGFSNPFSTAVGFELTIGKHVDNLHTRFTNISKHAGLYLFEGENTLTATDGAFAGTPSPLVNLTGLLYVDGQGVVYSCDQNTLTASVAYVPHGITDITIPASVFPDDGNEYKVNCVKRDSLKLATNLKAVVFEDPLAIGMLETHAMANCPNLESVNGETTLEGAEALFEHAEIGYNVFYNTGLVGAPGAGIFDQQMMGSENLKVNAEHSTELEINAAGENMQWVDNGDGTGGYRVLTGQTVTITSAVGNTEKDQESMYRVYFQITNEDANLSITPGVSEEFNGWPVSYYATDDPYTVYMEFGTPPEGNTSGLPCICSYPNVVSPGGGLTVWGVVVDPGTEVGSIIESESKLQISWVTKADDFAVSKKPSATSTIGVISDGAGGVRPSANVSWTVTLQRSTEITSSYGKDYASGAEFYDVFTLPAGVKWTEQVEKAIEDGNISVTGNIIYADEIPVAQISMSGSNIHLRGRRLSLEDGKYVLQWGVSSAQKSAEMNTATVTVSIYADALRVDIFTFDTEKPVEFINEVYATVHYTYRDDAKYSVDAQSGLVQNSQLYASASRPISGGAGNIKLKHTRSNVTYFGENVDFTLTVYNDGALPWIGRIVNENAGYTLKDVLQVGLYISPENMERMFAENPDLKITVSGATLGQWQTATGINGETVALHPGNSDSVSTVAGKTLTITAGEDGYTVSVNTGDVYTADTVGQALQNAGYAVTSSAAYSCIWPLNEIGSELVLGGGENRNFYVYATAKDSFQMIKTDWPSQYNSGGKVNTPATGWIYQPDGRTSHAMVTAACAVTRETVVSQSVTRDGNSLPSSYAINDDDVLDYQLALTHFGQGVLEDLPMVDDLYGSQYLLVPIAQNPALSDLPTHGDNYILTEGNYQNVIVGIDDEGNYLNAASISVKMADESDSFVLDGKQYSFTGLHTQIKWYFPDLPSGTYQMYVTFQTLADLDLTGVDYTIGNIVRMNDRTDDRLYAMLWGGGALIEFDKDIVLEKGGTHDADVLAADKYSVIGKGEKVTYRLSLSSTQEAVTVLKGDKLADALPVTTNSFAWTRDVNITDFRIEAEEGVTFENLDSWYVSDSYGDLVGQNQYIRWDKSAKITFTKPSSIYLYFTLTYPEDTPEAKLWTEFSDMVCGGRVYNDFYLYRYSKGVEHDLRESGRVFLQKGVYGTYHYGEIDGLYHSSSRLNYNNRDFRKRAVAYYVVLYNDANKRMYLDELYDRLPAGFTFLKFIDGNGNVNSSKTVTSVTTTSGSSPLTDLGAELVSYRSATVTANTANGLTFTISSGGGNNSVRYDESCDKYYLERGEAIEFGYICDVDTAEHTEANATNMIAMPYYDHIDTGTAIVMKYDVNLTAAVLEWIADENDGSRLAMSESQMSQNYGISGADVWLVSDVTMYRGGIVPGVTKYTDSYKHELNDVGIPYVNQVNHNSIVNWRVRLHNSGTLAMNDYTFTDIMPYPYSFVGTVTYTMHAGGYAGNSVSLVSVPEHVPEDGLSLLVKDLAASGSPQRTVMINGGAVEFGDSHNKFYLSLTLDENENEVLTIRFTGLHMTVMEGGYMDIQLSSVNRTGIYTYSVYTNQAMLTPTQDFTSVGQGSMVRDGENKPVAARNDSSVTVSVGFSTSSSKDAAQKDNAANSTVSANYIILPDVSSLVTYTLTVSNDTDKDMTRLVLIDSLPETGDHHPFDVNTDRNSEFTVSLADDPNFSVMIVPDDAQSYEPSDYLIQYSRERDFGGPHSIHWKGEMPEEGPQTIWSDDPENARSFRLIIRSAIPADAKVIVTFDAKVVGEPQPAQTAWNNFGYHYALDGQIVELEAMSPVVGVKTPGIPALVKRIVDSNGIPVKTLEDASFAFLVYEGAVLEGDFSSSAQLINALKAAGRNYHEFSVTVPAGEASSDQVYLTAENWDWRVGETYTVTELPTGERYSFRRFLGTPARSFRVTYDPALLQVITCENTLNTWTVRLHKENPSKEPLQGAVFALYSLYEEDMIDCPDTNILQQIVYNRQRWYFAGMQTTDADGVIEWEDLQRESYCVVETKAPDGYLQPTDPGQILYRSGSKQGIYTLKVLNMPSYELPNTGGNGVAVYALPGLLLMIAACSLLAFTKKPKRRLRN